MQKEGFGQSLPLYHPYTITVPGACAAWCDTVERFGRLDMARVLAPARRLAEEKAGVTPEQRAGIDEVASGAYAAALDYTNAAIAAGTISPYRRDSTGLLEVVGGLGGILGETQGKLGGVLTPAQRDAMAAAGFDWGEYLGTMAPWEDLDAPPPPPAP